MYEELCRLCGNKNNETLDIFSELGFNQKLELKIKEVVRLNILKDDPLPNVVCVLCIKHLENASYFIDHCHQTQTYLNQLYQDNLPPIHISNLFILNDTENLKHDQLIVENNDTSKSTPSNDSVSQTTAVNGASIETCNRRVSEDHEDSKTDRKFAELTNILNTEVQDDSFGVERIIFAKVLTAGKNLNNLSNDAGSTNNNSQIKTILQINSSNATNDRSQLSTSQTIPTINKDNSSDEINQEHNGAVNNSLKTILESNTSNTSNNRSQLRIKCTSQEIPMINLDESTVNDRSQLKRKCISNEILIIDEDNSNDERNYEQNDLSDDNFGFDSADDDDEEYESSGQTLKNSKQKSKQIPISNTKNLEAFCAKNSTVEQSKSSAVPKTNVKENDTNRKDSKDKKRLYCAACKKTFSQELTYQEHLNVHTGNRPFSCKLCTASFRRRQELNQHLRTVHSEKQLKCPSCDHVAKHKGKLTEHIKSVHDKPFTCDMCNYRTGEKGKIQQHIANKHTTNLSYVCEVCGNGFKTKSSLQVHIKNIHFPEPKVCQTCGTLCSSLARYSSHIFRCGKEKKRYHCEKCGKSYVNKEILRDHMNHHLNVKPYKCGICGKAFFQRSRLDMHKFVHRGANYQCEICNQFFNRKDNMKNHMKRHFYKSMRCDNTIVTAV